LPLFIRDLPTVPESVVPLRAGDGLIFYTDGIL